mgnify:CR=1 FL=1
MRRKVNKAELQRRLVARLTKGSAFMLNHNDYQAMQTKTELEVSNDIANLPPDDFTSKYEIYLYDVKLPDDQRNLK